MAESRTEVEFRANHWTYMTQCTYVVMIAAANVNTVFVARAELTVASLLSSLMVSATISKLLPLYYSKTTTYLEC